MLKVGTCPAKAADADIIGRFREVISDPLNVLIERVPQAGTVEGNDVYLHNGNRVPVSGDGAYYGSFSSLLVINRGVHEPVEEFVFQEILKRVQTAPRMIELGAYWAHYSMWLKRVKPQAVVIMVEPDPKNLAAGQANFGRNGFEGEFIQASVGKGHWELDDFFATRGLAHLDILHVDIQGAEAELLDGGRRTLGNAQVDYLCVSTHSQALHRSVADALTGLGYRVEVSSDFDNETTSSDGFIFAASQRVQPIFTNFQHFGRKAIATSGATDALHALIGMSDSTISAGSPAKGPEALANLGERGAPVEIVYKVGEAQAK
jgi:Methyltransferase FkbM domain